MFHVYERKNILNHQIQKHKCPHIWSLFFSLYIFHCAQYCKWTFTKAFFSQWNIRLCAQFMYHCVDHHLRCYTKGIQNWDQYWEIHDRHNSQCRQSGALEVRSNSQLCFYLISVFYSNIFQYVSSGFHFFICIHFLCCEDSCLENWLISSKERKNKRGMGENVRFEQWFLKLAKSLCWGQEENTKENCWSKQ